MKTLKIISLFILCIALILGCAKDDELMENQDEMMLKKASKAPVFVVTPTGTDDTQSIIDAFTDAMNEGEGSVVQLTEGFFYIDMIAIYNFCGTLTGAGKGITVINPVSNLNVEAPGLNNTNPVLFKFVGGDVCVKDLTICTPSGKFGGIGYLEGLIGFFGYSVVQPDNDYINVVIDNIEVNGQPENVGYGLITGSDFYWYNTDVHMPYSNMDISVTNSDFSNCAWYNAIIMIIDEGKIDIGRNGKGNTFTGSGNPGGWDTGLAVWFTVNVDCKIEGNTFNDLACGFEVNNNPASRKLIQCEQTESPLIDVSHNLFDEGVYIGMWINERRRFNDGYEDEPPMLVQVKSNKFKCVDAYLDVVSDNTSGMVIRNNQFSGSSLAAIYTVSQKGPDNVNGLILGNNFSDENYQAGIVDIYLDKGTKDWTLVGDDLGESVFDLGENNIISGYQTSDVSLGQTIQDNLKMVRDAMNNNKKSVD